MEDQLQTKSESKEGGRTKALSPSDLKYLTVVYNKINKKGRPKVTYSAILGRGLRKLDEKDFAELQSEAFTKRQRIELAHERYQKKHGKISYVDFIEKLMLGEVSDAADLYKSEVR